MLPDVLCVNLWKVAQSEIVNAGEANIGEYWPFEHFNSYFINWEITSHVQLSMGHSIYTYLYI